MNLWPNLQWRRRAGRLAGLVALLSLCGGLAELVRAEGSRTLYPAGAPGHRGNIEWRTSFYGDFLRRRSLFKLYVQAGEVILLGSSAVGVAQGDILVYRPGRVTGRIGDETIPDGPDFTCADQRAVTANPDQGRITNRTMELAGPATITDTATASPGDDIPNAYIPCFYLAPETGVYHVIFFGPYGGDSNEEIAPTGEVELTGPENFDETQATSTAAWDVTVRSDLTSTTDLDGRLFADYVTQFVGGNPRPVYSDVFIVTHDGYRYRNNLRTLDPDGFIIFANEVGFLNSNGDPLFHDVMADPSLPPPQANQLDVRLGGTGLAPPTHLVFFNPPSPEALEANNIPLEAIAPELSGFAFQGVLGENDTYVGGGGSFSFTTNATGLFELIISQDGLDFDPSNPLNRVIRRPHSGGAQTIAWDGLDNTGQPFPVGQDYPARLTLRAGEHHFPILDPENSLEGGPTYELLNPPQGACPVFNGNPPNCFLAFYDDRGYVTANGTAVGTPGEPLPGNGPPSPAHADLLAGFDTRTTQRSFGNGAGDGFGDKKGLDLWTFYPSQAELTRLDIFPLNLAIGKSDGGVTARPGQTVVYTLTYSNTTQVEATGVVITETVPLYTTFDQSGSSPTVWSCAHGSPAGTACTTAVGTVTGRAGGQVYFAVRLDEPLPAGVTHIENVALIGDDGSHGGEPTGDNSAPEDTPVVPPSNGGDDGGGDDGGDGDDGDDEDDGDGDDDDDDDGKADDDDDDNGDGNGVGGPAPGLVALSPAATPTPGVTPAPALPVTLLPETGEPPDRPWPALLGMLVLLGLGLYIWRMEDRR
jgi:uncharacterized repeat protein (TIGR01451 family)